MFEKLHRLLKAKLEREEPLEKPKVEKVVPVVKAAEPVTPPKKEAGRRANGRKARRLTQNMKVGLLG